MPDDDIPIDSPLGKMILYFFKSYNESFQATVDQLSQPKPSHHKTLIGYDVQTSNQIEIGDIERRSGLYVLGKPRMGKSTLFINMIAQDMEKGHSVFLLDPHGQAIRDLFERYPQIKFALQKECIYLLDPTDEAYCFGINPLYCPDVTSLAKRQQSYDKAFDIFKRIWEKENQWGVWLERILQSLLPIFIELQEYTLAEMPLFLNDAAFRNYILPQVKYNTHLVDYWRYEYEEKQAQSARNRVGSLLANPYVRHIIGQQRTTIDFEQIVKSTTRRQLPQFVFLRLPATLADDARHFIGTIIVTELLHALQTRDPQEAEDNFCLYVDEFQNFATSQLAKFILEAGKWGCAISLAHQERRGQFTENDEILGATMASANKVIFQCTVNDARELAPEFAEKPVALDTRLVPEMVIHKEPMWHLLQIGHKNDRIMEIFRNYLEPFFTLLNKRKDEAEAFALERSGHFDHAMLYRDASGLSGVNRENQRNMASRGRDIVISHSALDRSEALLQQAMQQHQLAERMLEEMGWTLRSIQAVRGYVKWIERVLVTIMETGYIPEVGTEALAQFLVRTTNSRMAHICDSINELYIWVKYGDPQQPRMLERSIFEEYGSFIKKYFYKLAETVYVQSKTRYIFESIADPNSKYKYSKEEIALRISEYRTVLNKDMKYTRMNLVEFFIQIWILVSYQNGIGHILNYHVTRQSAISREMSNFFRL